MNFEQLFEKVEQAFDQWFLKKPKRDQELIRSWLNKEENISMLLNYIGDESTLNTEGLKPGMIVRWGSTVYTVTQEKYSGMEMISLDGKEITTIGKYALIQILHDPGYI